MAERADDPVITAAARAAGRGDRAALAAFVRATQGDVYRFLLHLGGRGDTEDLAQETYLRAIGALPDFAGRSSARTWLLSIARHVAADAVRGASRRPRTTGVEDWEALVVPATMTRGGADEAVLVRALVAALDTDRREAFVLTQMLGLSYEDTAQVCGCPVGTVRSRVSRARQDLVAALDEFGHRHASGG